MTIAKRPAIGAFVASAATVYALIFFVMRMPSALARPGLMGTAAMMDLTITVAAVCWFVLLRPGYAKWPVVLLTALVGLRVSTFLLPVPEQTHVHFLRWIGAPLELWILARVLWRLPKINCNGDSLSTIHAVCLKIIPYESAAGTVASEIAVFYYALFSWRAKPETRSGWKTFHYAEASGWASFPMLLGIAVVFEAFPVHFVLRTWSPTAAWVVTGLDFYGLLWLIAVARAARLRPILVGADRVLFRIGLIWDAEFELASVKGLKHVTAVAPNRREKGYLQGVVMNDPQWIVEFHEPVVVHGLFGTHRAVTRIGVAVDDGASFVKALTKSNPSEIS
jgi:hypothetical protein